MANLDRRLAYGVCCTSSPAAGAPSDLRLLAGVLHRPPEKLCASVGLSLVLLYVISFGIHWMSPPGNQGDVLWTIAARTVSVLCVVLGIAVFRDAARLAACRQVRNVLLGVLFLLIWTLSILCVIRHYSGGGWEGDWLEHFQRTLFFLHRFPEWTPIIGDYGFPARPPMMNLLGAFFLAQVGDRFELFQVVFAFLNVLVFLPCCLIVPALAKRSRRRRNRWRELLAVATLTGMLLATWFAWSVIVYGPRMTFGSNSTVRAAMVTEGGNSTQVAKKFAVNLFRTTVPHPLRWDVPRNAYAQPSAAGRLRDYMFLIYQTNAIFGMGLIAGPAVLFLLYRSFWRKRGGHGQPQRCFWLMLLPSCLVLGIAAHPISEVFGVAHVTLQPLIVLGLSLLAGDLASLPRVAASVVLLGCLIDFSFGVLLQTQVQSLENGRDKTVFTGVTVQNGRPALGTPQEHSLSRAAWGNWFRKHQLAASNEWLQQLKPYSGADVEAIRSELERYRREDELYWHGWYARNGGSLVFLGDRTAGWSAGGPVAAALIGAALGLIGATWRQSTPCRRAR